MEAQGPGPEEKLGPHNAPSSRCPVCGCKLPLLLPPPSLPPRHPPCSFLAHGPDTDSRWPTEDHHPRLRWRIGCQTTATVSHQKFRTFHIYPRMLGGPSLPLPAPSSSLPSFRRRGQPCTPLPLPGFGSRSLFFRFFVSFCVFLLVVCSALGGLHPFWERSRLVGGARGPCLASPSLWGRCDAA